ncbi:MAG TPA: lasso peptide biosynthesis B2 protein [Pyrinomonadaceae bacterium]
MTPIAKAFEFARRATRKFVSDPREALLLCRMGWWVSVLSVGARCCSLPRALALVAGKQGNQTSAADINKPEQLARAIDLLLSADFLMFKPICWKRAAVLHRYLSRHGITTRIIFGVRNEAAGKVAGHAWLEADGEPILESTPPEYVITYRFPSNEHLDPQLAALRYE